MSMETKQRSLKKKVAFLFKEIGNLFPYQNHLLRQLCHQEQKDHYVSMFPPKQIAENMTKRNTF